MTGVELRAVEVSRVAEISGVVLFEDEETRESNPLLFKEQPRVVVELVDQRTQEVVKSMSLTESHYFQFGGLRRDTTYSIQLKPQRGQFDKRHSQLATFDAQLGF